MKDRLAQLERLVMSVVTNPMKPGSQTHLTPESITEAEPSSAQGINKTHADSPDHSYKDERSDCGSMRISASELLYVDGEHWTAILENISDLKDYLDRQEQLSLADTTDNDRNEYDEVTTPLLYRRHPPFSRAEILAELPPKVTVDRYVARCFNRVDLIASCRCSPHQFAGF